MAWEGELMGPDVASAGSHVSERIGRDVAATQLDLEESLEASRFTSHPYTSYPQDWPDLFEVGETRDLPAKLLERYNSVGEAITLCGLFPQINRAWASVDNSFFIWRYNKWDNQCKEYNEEQPIVSVGLARAKPGVFVEAIQYLLVLATQVELILLGVCCTSSGDHSDAYAELALQPLPEYRIPSDGAEAVCITSTDSGRIFMSARNGQIYELTYSNGSGWKKRFRSVCVTSSIFTWFLPNALTFGAADPIVQMVPDNERHILFARTENTKLQVYDLGENGEGQLRKIAEEKTLTDPRDTTSHRNRRTGTGTKPSIACITPLSRAESKRLNLVVVLSDGKRLYLTTSNDSSSFGLTGTNNSHQRPNCLKVISTRPSPPLGPISNRSQTIQQPDSLALKADAAFYSFGSLILSDSSSVNSCLISVQRDPSLVNSVNSRTGLFGTGTTGTMGNNRALREIVSVSSGTGLMFCAADILPSNETVSVVQSLYSDVEPLTGLKSDPFDPFGAREALKLWAKGDLYTQHILPRRKFVVFSNMGLTEVVCNRPLDILKKLFEKNASQGQIKEFFDRYGTGESAAMCLILASKLAFNDEDTVSNTVSEKAAEVFENPSLVGTTQAGTGISTGTGTRSPPAGGGYNMGQVVQEVVPTFSGAYEGLCLCASRLLVPVWDFPIVSVRGQTNGVVVLRIENRAMGVLEGKVRALEYFLRSRRDNRRGLYGLIASTGDYYSGGVILYDDRRGPQVGGSSAKRQRPLISSSQLTAMEVRAIDCLRRLLRRSGEALYLLQIVSQHNISRLAQHMDPNTRQKLVNLTFHKLVCSNEGDQIASVLISGLMEYYVGPERSGSLDDISTKLREGCPSYFNEAEFTFFMAIEHLERASISKRADERVKLSKDAFSAVKRVPHSVDLVSLCKRFEAVRFYEAVVLLPLQKAQELASNPDTDPSELEQCYSIITNALKNLTIGAQQTLDEASKRQYIRQIIQLGLESKDTGFREHLYRNLIDLGLENELLQYGDAYLVTFLQNAAQESRGVHSMETNIGSDATKYIDLLAKYFVSKGQHREASHVLYRLAERQGDPNEGPTLEQRHQYLSNAVLQAKTAAVSTGPTRNATEEGFLNILEDKLTVLGFQMRIIESLESIVSGGTCGSLGLDEGAVKEKLDELKLNLKSITQLYNEYAMPFQLWEACLEILNFANYTGEADNNRVVTETWARLLDKSLSSGGVKEACSVLKRVGPKLYDGDGACLPLDSICLHLERAALERLTKGVELIGDEDVARALLASCGGAFEPIVGAYDKLLSNAAIVPSLALKLRLFRSILFVLREWSLTVSGSGVNYSGAFWMNRTNVINLGVKDKIVTLANKYMVEVRRLLLPQNQTESVALGFRELEEHLLTSSTSYSPF